MDVAWFAQHALSSYVTPRLEPAERAAAGRRPSGVGRGSERH
jgi:hypothetical protein